ncbi:MAG: hypothetical protein I8H77_05070 [Comamonadaceae bacterium]|nr:hypothetical protein [Comamonadaceae bacterium]
MASAYLMRKLFSCVLLCLFSSIAHGAGSEELRSFTNKNVGKVSLMAPRDWKPVERHSINFGTTFYRFQPSTDGEFDFEILVNDLAHMEIGALVDKDLERYIQSNMASAAPQSLEGKASVFRFVRQHDGVYARLTDKAPKPGEFKLFTQGVRLQGQGVVLFTLYSNDKDGAILKKALAVVESLKFEQ